MGGTHEAVEGHSALVVGAPRQGAVDAAARQRYSADANRCKKMQTDASHVEAETRFDVSTAVASTRVTSARVVEWAAGELQIVG